ncbi:MAG: META domain-containing protein [Chloroflexi bacterium]|nr:META domain-containing protein [Chloroflexota bacterium]
MVRRIPVALLLVLAVAALALAGCAAPGKGASLEGTRWTLAGWSVSSLHPEDFAITAEFTDGRIGGRAAVNWYGGEYKAGPGSAFQVGQTDRTLMAGPEDAMRAEDIYHKLLAQARQFRLEGDALTLSDVNGNALLIFAAAE